MISRNTDLLDHAISNDPDFASHITKNVCAKLSVELSDKIDETCNLLDVSKRQFIENALIEALDRSQQLIDEIDPFEVNSK
jgi:hypothetical protein